MDLHRRLQLTSARQSETLRAKQFGAGVMMRVGTAAVLVALGGAVFGPTASAQSAPQDSRIAQQWNSGATDASAQRQNRRPPTRLKVQPYYESSFDGVYPRYYPGRNAVRECTANYVQEFRPSGTVIVPRMNCFWRPG